MSVNDFVKSNFLKEIIRLTQSRLIATDEPPMQLVTHKDNILNIVRPLINVYEQDIVNYKEKNNINTEKSGCGHSLSKESQTTRELIHYSILQNIPINSNSEAILNELRNQIEYGLDINGKLIKNVRNERNLILGENYKNGFGNNIKI
jgi:tRNA(Ile)-lysidine synthase TilS/MesJ